MKKVILGIFLGLLILLSSCIVTQQGKFSIDNIEEASIALKLILVSKIPIMMKLF